MPSFWNWLCFPRNHGVSGKNNNPHRRRRTKQNVVTLQKRKLLEDASHFKEEKRHVNNSEINQMANKNVPYKRRRVQDIFSDNEPAHTSAEETVSNVRTCQNNLSHMRVPNLFNQKRQTYQNSCENIESMYGYVPKTMQNLYTSTALEGQKIEDYFANLHNDIYFSKFANSEAAIKDNSAANILQRLPFTRKTSSVFEQEEKVSLIESKDSDEEMEAGLQHDFNTWQNSVSPRTDYNMEDNFKSIFDSREEVLY